MEVHTSRTPEQVSGPSQGPSTDQWDGLTAILAVAEEGGGGIPGRYPGNIPVSALPRIYAESAASINRKARGPTYCLSVV